MWSATGILGLCDAGSLVSTRLVTVFMLEILRANSTAIVLALLCSLIDAGRRDS